MPIGKQEPTQYIHSGRDIPVRDALPFLYTSSDMSMRLTGQVEHQKIPLPSAIGPRLRQAKHTIDRPFITSSADPTGASS